MASTREEVKRLLDKGLTVRQIAAVLHLTTQAVYLHVAKLREDSEASA